MTTLAFGDFAANMNEPEYFGFTAWFPSADADLFLASPNFAILRDPATGSTIALESFGPTNTAVFAGLMN